MDANIIEVGILAEGKIKTRPVHQWDIGQTIKITDTEIADGTPVDFSNKFMAEGIRTYTLDNEVRIPAPALQQSYDLMCYLVISGEDSETTVREIFIPVIAKAKPEDYIGEEIEEMTEFKYIVQKANESEANANAAAASATSAEASKESAEAAATSAASSAESAVASEQNAASSAEEALAAREAAEKARDEVQSIADSGFIPSVSTATAGNVPVLTADGTLIDSGEGLPEKVTETLSAGETELSIANSAITTSSLIDIYTNVFGVNPTNIVVTSGNLLLDFEPQEEDIGVLVEIRQGVNSND